MQGLEHEPTPTTRAYVVSKRTQGHTHEQIADYLDISDVTLTKYYGTELRVGKSAFLDDVLTAFHNRLKDGSDMLIKLALTHQGGWRSADKIAEVDALKENTAALKKKAATDELTAELRDHLKADAALDTAPQEEEASNAE